MTSPKTATVDDEPLGVWLRTHRRELIAIATADITARVDGALAVDPELGWIVGYNLDLFARFLESGEVVGEGDAADLVASATRRAAEGEPLEHLLRDYQVGFDAVWRVIATRLDEPDAVVELTSRAHAHLLAVTTLVMRGFQREAMRVGEGARDARYEVYAALLTGGGAAEAASRAGVTLSAHHLVLALRFPPLGTEVSTSVARHRRSNDVQRILEEVVAELGAEGEVLALVGDPTGTAVLPLRHLGDDTVSAAITLLTVLGDLGAHVGAVPATTAEVPRAEALAADLAALAATSGRPCGVVTLDDMLLEHQLTRPGPGRDRLLARLAPLDDHPEWAQTLIAYRRHGFDRRATAAELHLHPNSVDYRLARVAELCGFDARDPGQRALVVAAVALRSSGLLGPIP